MADRMAEPMANVYRRHACTEREALERLASEAEFGMERLSRVRIEFDSSVHRRITLWVPDVVGQPLPPAAALDVDRGLALLLVNSTPDARRAATPCDERLFITARLSSDAVVATLRRLERFATPARVAKLRSEGGADVWLLHVLVDRARHSGFSGLEALGLFEPWSALTGYESEGCRLFLTSGVSLSRDLLPPLWRLMSNDGAASLLSLAPQGPRGERFYVISRSNQAGTANEFERITLPPQAFVDSIEVGFALDASLRLSTLSRGTEPADLARHLREQAPARGYRLRLESTRAVEEAGRDLDRLRSQQAYLTQRIAYAESLHRPRPRLLRFNARQLAALAHSIYSFAPDSLFAARPHVRYAFQATPQEPAGFHYLWIDPEAVRRTPDPLPLYESSPPMRFWLDPTWGRHYHDDAAAAGCVFVPEHTALRPPLHTWIPGDMDAHLRRVFGQPSPETHVGGHSGRRTSDDARRSVYVLDVDPVNAAALELTILERAAFEPIDAAVNWLNDHITVADRVDVTQLLRDAAATTRAELLASDAIEAASTASRNFRRDAARTRERFMRDLDAVISSINRCTFDVLQRAHLAIDGMRSLDQDLNSLADIRERAAGIVSVTDLLNAVDGLTMALRDRVSALEREVGEALRQADAQSEDEQRRIEAYIQSLEVRRDALRERLQRDAAAS
jgi:hypothetical protein